MQTDSGVLLCVGKKERKNHIVISLKMLHCSNNFTKLSFFLKTCELHEILNKEFSTRNKKHRAQHVESNKVHFDS